MLKRFITSKGSIFYKHLIVVFLCAYNVRILIKTGESKDEIEQNVIQNQHVAKPNKSSARHKNRGKTETMTA